jgi:serine/threonine protein kinase
MEPWYDLFIDSLLWRVSYFIVSSSPSCATPRHTGEKKFLRAMPLPDVPPEGELWEGGGRKYRMEKVVGNGAFGIVWRAREEGGSTSVAIKKVVLDRRYHNRELEMMKGLEHECVIKLHHHFEKP